MKLPSAFSERMRKSLGDEEYLQFTDALDDEAPVSIRINNRKYTEVPALEKIPWSDYGYFLESRPLFSSDPLWHAGAYYVQEASSMLLEQAFKKAKSKTTSPVKVLDACAAPGGKSVLIASLLNEDDILVCNEVIRSRVPVLFENVRKHGYTNTIITSADTSDFAHSGELFDIIVADAPCSGEGLFRKDKNAVDEWSEENVKICELRQSRILHSLSACLKPGGILIYSTCTYNPGENQIQVENLCKNGFKPYFFQVNGNEYSSFQCYPHRFRGEGFFLAMLQKSGEPGESKPKKGKGLLKPVKQMSEWKEYLNSDFAFYSLGNSILYGNEDVFRFQSEYLQNIYCYSAGNELGTMKDKFFQISELLAFSLALNRDAFQYEDLDQETAIAYLSRHSVPISGNKRGYTILRFEGIPIGFGKYAGNRINNLFPAEWKLRTIPEPGKYFTLNNKN